MSTSDESDRETGAEELDLELPPEWRASPGDFEGGRAAVLVPPERHELIRQVLRHAADIRFVADLAELLAADADLIVVGHQFLAEVSAERRSAVLRQWRERLDPIRVVIDAPYGSRVALQVGDSVDLAAEPEIDWFELEARIWALLRRVRLERDRSPLTGLPGNRWLVRYVEEMLRDDREIGVLLLDIDDFKRYNDRCGHLRGDAAILALALAASQAAALHGSFAAHVGGDDFCVVCTPEVLDDVAGACLSTFEIQTCALADRELTITLAGTVVSPAHAGGLEQVFERLAHLETQGKLRPGSNYVRRDECGGDGAGT